MDAAARGLIAAAALCAASACEKVDYLGADTFYVGRMMWRVQHEAWRQAMFAVPAAPVKVDLLAMVCEALGLDEDGFPKTEYPSMATTLAPTKSWLAGARVLCFERGGEPSYKGGRFDPFECLGPPVYTPDGFVMEGNMLYRVIFLP